MSGLLLKGRPPPPTRIAAPTGLSIISTASGQADVSWGSVAGATSYTVRQGTKPMGYTNVYALGNVLTYNNTGLQNGIRSYWCVTALDANGDSAYSTEISVIPLAAPTGVAATPGSSKNTLSWAPVTGATSYTIRKGTTSNVYPTTIVAGNVTSYQDTGLTAGITYYYRVYATGVNATGDNSAEFSGIPTGIVATTAVGSDNDGDYLRLQSADYPTSPSSYSIAIWAKRTADRNTYNWVWALETPAGHSTEWNGFMLDADGTTLCFEETAGHTVTIGTMTANVWYFLAASVNGANVSVWYATEGSSSLTKLTSSSFTPMSGFDELTIMASIFHAAEFFDGHTAMARIWDGQLSDAEALAEFLSVTPVKTSGLQGAWPLASVATITNATSGLPLTTSGFSSYTNQTGPNVGI